MKLGCSVEELLSDQPEIATTKWDANLYQEACVMVCAEITRLSLQPDPQAIAECINEAYAYAQGSPEYKVDQRFVTWLVPRKISSPDIAQD